MKQRKKKVNFLENYQVHLLGKCPSLLGNLFAGEGAIRAGEGIIRAEQNF